MLRLVTDEDFNNDILRGLLRQQEALDIVRVQDVGLRQADDDSVLEWAAHNKRLVVTHDANTMTRAAYDRAV
jgi:predicted nuclease of predicted toxin-antitoxin system